jgi:hypothetical protein
LERAATHAETKANVSRIVNQQQNDQYNTDKPQQNERTASTDQQQNDQYNTDKPQQNEHTASTDQQQNDQISANKTQHNKDQ